MIEFLDNQPVIFDQEFDPLICNTFTWKQLIWLEQDTTNFQIKIDTCSPYNTELLTCNDFTCSTDWTLGGGWAISTNTLNITNSVGNQDADQGGIYAINRRYKVVIDVASIDGSIGVSTNGVTFEIIETAGIHTFYFKRNAVSDAFLIRAFNGASVVINSASVKVVPVNVWLSIWDADGTFIDVIKAEDENAGEVSIDFNYITFTVNWESYVAEGGCYYFCLHDPCINTNGQQGLYNGEFNISNATDDEGFTIVNTGMITTSEIDQGGSGKWDVTSAGIGDSTITSDSTVLTGGISYDFEVKIDILPAGWSVEIFAGTVSQLLNSAGTHNFTLVANTTAAFKAFVDAVTINTSEIDYIRIELSDNQDLVCNHQSPEFKVLDPNVSGDLAILHTTKKIQLCANDNPFGWNWYDEINDSQRIFFPCMRVCGSLTRTSYNTERSAFDNSKGKYLNIWGKSNNIDTLIIDFMQIYAHDFLRLITISDSFSIDLVNYQTVDTEYPLNFPERDRGVASSEVEVRKQTELIEKTNCRGNEEC